MIPIYIPSRKRAHQLKSEFNPIRYMSPLRRTSVTYVVDDGDIDDYRFDLPNNVRIIEWRGQRNIAAKRKYIGELASLQKHDKFCMMDDDIKFFRRADDESTTLLPIGPDFVDVMMHEMKSALELGNGHVGVSAREGNNNFGPAQSGSFERDTRIMRCAAFWTGIFNEVAHERVQVMEDFDVALQILERGYHNANLTYWAQDQGGTQSRGGCADWRTKELHEASAKELARLHPGLVRLREKRNKTGGDFGTRTEVTISWKKAFGAGVRDADTGGAGREHDLAAGAGADTDEGGATK